MLVLFNFYRKFKRTFQRIFPRLYKHADSHKDKVKFVFSGGTATVSDFILLFALHGVMGINVIISAVIAFVFAFFISFYMQKFWTFRDNRRDVLYKQMFYYLLIAVVGITATAIGIYTLVIKLGVWYIFAQAMIGGTMAIGNFLVYKLIIFRRKKKES